MITNSFFHRIIVRYQGRRDGLAGIPAEDATRPSLAVLNLIKRANMHIGQIQKKAREKNEKLEGRERNLQDQYLEIDKDFDWARGTYTAKREEMGRDVDIKFPRAGYWTLMTVLVIAELPFNWTVFNSVSQESALMTAIMSFVVALSIPAAAHFVGTWIQQWADGWKTAAQVLISTTAIVLGLLALNQIRILMMNETSTAGPGSASIQYAYFTINLMVFVVATIAAMFTHDKDSDFEAMQSRAQKLSNRRRRIVQQLEQTKSRRDQLLVRTQEELNIVRNITEQLATIYRSANNRNRKPDSGRPAQFDEPLDFDPERLWEPASPTENGIGAAGA